MLSLEVQLACQRRNSSINRVFKFMKFSKIEMSQTVHVYLQATSDIINPDDSSNGWNGLRWAGIGTPVGDDGKARSNVVAAFHKIP